MIVFRCQVSGVRERMHRLSSDSRLLRSWRIFMAASDMIYNQVVDILGALLQFSLTILSIHLSYTRIQPET